MSFCGLIFLFFIVLFAVASNTSYRQKAEKRIRRLALTEHGAHMKVVRFVSILHFESPLQYSDGSAFSTTEAAAPHLLTVFAMIGRLVAPNDERWPVAAWRDRLNCA